MTKINCATVPLKRARKYSETEFLKVHKSLDKVLPNFDRNYMLLQDRCKNALNIPRSQMPVIEPKDMAKFQRKIKAGHIDIFRPYASTNVFPKKFIGKKDAKYLTLGLKDGRKLDDVIKAKIIHVPAIKLLPLQSQIWLDKLIKYTIQYGAPKKGSRVTKTTIIISSNYYILDGHHRYGQVMLADPSLKMSCLFIPLSIGLLLKMTRSYGMAIGNPPNY